MGRNDGYHHHSHNHKSSSHSRGSSSSSSSSSSSRHHHHHQHHHHHHHRQHQQHSGNSGSKFRNDQSYQMSPFAPVQQQQQPSPFVNPQFSQTIFSPQQQQTHMHNLQQQQIYNQGLPLALNASQTNILPESPIWFNQCPQNLPVSSGATLNLNLPLEQSIPAAALNKLQLPADQITETGIIPNTPYYDLPAGLIVPLISPPSSEYKTVDPADLRLPLPKFPDENFLRTIDAYYGSDGKSRDNDGWDREFMDAYLAQKKTQAES